jgi:hypothetical protein
MKGLRYWCWLGCLGAGLLGAPSVHAAGGRISFSGAVVEPTCGVDPAQLALAGQPLRQACAATGRPAENGPQTFAVTVRPLADGANGDRLLAYFSHNLAVLGGNARPTLVTQTYE